LAGIKVRLSEVIGGLILIL